jgi:hypothetical protein
LWLKPHVRLPSTPVSESGNKLAEIMAHNLKEQRSAGHHLMIPAVDHTSTFCCKGSPRISKPVRPGKCSVATLSACTTVSSRGKTVQNLTNTQALTFEALSASVASSVGRWRREQSSADRIKHLVVLVWLMLYYSDVKHSFVMLLSVS